MDDPTSEHPARNGAQVATGFRMLERRSPRSRRLQVTVLPVTPPMRPACLCTAPAVAISTIFMTTISVIGSSLPQSSCSTSQTRWNAARIASMCSGSRSYFENGMVAPMACSRPGLARSAVNVVAARAVSTLRNWLGTAARHQVTALHARCIGPCRRTGRPAGAAPHRARAPG